MIPIEDKNKDIAILLALAEGYFSSKEIEIVKLPGAGSGRKYYRIFAGDSTNKRSCIGVAGDNLRDCHAFVNLDKIFVKEKICVPEVYAVSEDGLHYIQEDFGNKSLFDIVKDGDLENYEILIDKLVRISIEELVRMQTVDVSKWETSTEYLPWGKRQVMWDLNYFKYEYLRTSSVDFDEEKLEDDFENFADDICNLGKSTDGFMYRDFQSRNVMIQENKGKTPESKYFPGFIDFQGGRRGPGVYDIVSFLWQAKAGFSDSFRSKMIDYYFRARGKRNYINIDFVEREKIIDMFALFRTLQVLGAYGLRGLVEHKAHFIESIPGALENLGKLLDKRVAKKYPELERVCTLVCADSRFKRKNTEGLTVEVFSFSYKKGYPQDFTGNGGGFMFDCRGMHNPGRYEEYKQLTGRDKPVIDFLENQGEVQKFVENAVSIVSPSIETYLRRGFSNLQIGFGCTGGQHRSVYCAENVASKLRQRFPKVKVVLIHREHPSC